MRAHVEPISGILRVFAEGHEYGDPYEWACTVRWISRRVVELCGVTAPPRPSHLRAMRAELLRFGAEVLVMRRRGRKKVWRLTPTGGEE